MWLVSGLRNYVTNTPSAIGNGRPIAAFVNNGQHEFDSPVARRIAWDRPRSRLPWGLLLVLELYGRGGRGLCNRLPGHRDGHHPGF